MIEALYGRRFENGRVRCDLCPHHCLIKPGRSGRCFVRCNIGGRLMLLSGARVSALAVDPVEKKPLYHFLPGTPTLSIGAIGCNLACSFCQNFTISQPGDDAALGGEVTPEALADLAVRRGCPSVSFTYNEPIVTFEHVRACARVCRARGRRAIAVTAGFVAARPRAEFFADIDAANVDLKSFRDAFYRDHCGARLAPVLETLEYLRGRVWLEITTLLIPGLNDSDGEIRDLSRWVAGHLGPDVPLHFSAFYPMHRMTDRPPADLVRLRRARDLARGEGLRFVYTGNVHDPEGGETVCPRCKAKLVCRERFSVTRIRLAANGRCPDCGEIIPGVWA